MLWRRRRTRPLPKERRVGELDLKWLVGEVRLQDGQARVQRRVLERGRVELLGQRWHGALPPCFAL